MKIVIQTLIDELATWFSLSDDMQVKAANSKITNMNNARFRVLCTNWINGLYDEDMHCLKQEIENLLRHEANN